MLSQEVEEKLAEVLVDRIEEVNSYILKQVGKTIEEISTLKPSDAYRLGQIIKYGGSYEKIAKELARITGRNIQDIYAIFEEVAKNNKQFAKDFYKYRGIDYIPYKKDLALQYQVNSLATMTANAYMNMSNTRGIGYMVRGLDGQLRFKGMRDAYSDIIDRAIIGIAQGKTTFQEEMRNALRDMGNNGLVVYESGRVRRFDSAVRMNILDGIRQLNIETSKRFGAEYGADGVEISVHSNPAPDHADIQGRQFSNIEYEKLENGRIATDVKGIEYDGSDKRHIGEYNCYHKIFAIVLGVSEPEYTDKELKEIKEQNEKGFDYNGKHYTMYEGTQLQRKLELEVRKAKDTQILARASGDDFKDLAEESQVRINSLTKEYDKLCKTSGLIPKKERMSVSGYRKIKTNIQIEPKDIAPKKLTEEQLDDEFYMLAQDLEAKNVRVDNSVFNLQDRELRNEQLQQLNLLTDKYNHNISRKVPLRLGTNNKNVNNYATSSYTDGAIYLNKNHFTTKEHIEKLEERNMELNWHYKTDKKDMSVYTITHEYGHILEYEYYFEKNKWSIVRQNKRLDYYELDTDLRDTLIAETMRKTGEALSITQFKQKYWSDYAISKRHSEWFAETFANYILGKDKNVWTETFGEWLEEFYNGNK